MRVLKFGGTSVGSTECLTTALEIIQKSATRGRIVVVVSALGGVTNLLLEAIAQSRRGEDVRQRLLGSLRERHQNAAKPLVAGTLLSGLTEEQEQWLNFLANRLLGVSSLRDCTPRTTDEILSVGERLSLPLVVAALKSRGLPAVALDATALIRTDNVHGDAGVLHEESRLQTQAALGALERGTIPVVSGFIGKSTTGAVTTLGRGGSDYSAALLGSFLDVEGVEIWTDTDGVLTADPQVVREAVPLAFITYREAADLSLLGARVLHPRTVDPLEARGIPLTIRNTFRPEHPGTVVVKEPSVFSPGVKSITSLTGAASVTVRCPGGLSPAGLYHRLFAVLDRFKIPVLALHPSLSDGSLTFLTYEARQGEVVQELENEFTPERKNRSWSIETRNHLSMITAVGTGINNAPTVGRRFLETLEQQNVRPLALAQGISDLSLSAVIESGTEPKAVKALHSEFILKRRRVGLVIAGPTGKVGRALLQLLADRQEGAHADPGVELLILGALNTRQMLWNPRGIDPRHLLRDLPGGETSRWAGIFEQMRTHRGCPVLFLDCTASPELAAHYVELLTAGIGIVTPNKIANTLDYGYYQTLHRLGRGRTPYRYATTVGAATPMLRALADLRSTGDRIQKVEGVLSGTLSFVFNRLNHGDRLSEAVKEAARRGFSEPHPATDLSGEDVARKLLILAREAGYPLERRDIVVEGIVPGSLGNIADPEEYLRRLSIYDDAWAEAARRARDSERRLTYLASFDGKEASVGVQQVPRESPFVRLGPSENAVHYYSDRHTPLPLTIQGIGAGPEVTARGVLADILQTIEDLAA
jgi:aspartokinase/homoserine dehydrogenase 1